jgi:hypothetical protein
MGRDKSGSLTRLRGNAIATGSVAELTMRPYRWSHLVGETGERRRFFAVLHLGGIRSPVDAVRAAIVAENKGRR